MDARWLKGTIFKVNEENFHTGFSILQSSTASVIAQAALVKYGSKNACCLLNSLPVR